MAKLESRLRGNFTTVLNMLHDQVLNGSFSASYEDGSDYQNADGTRVAVRVYERYSYLGGNRVSMNHETPILWPPEAES